MRRETVAVKWFLLFLTFALPTQAFDRATLCGSHRNYVPIARRMKPGLLFGIERCDTPKSYLFGTIHSDDLALLTENADAQAALLSVKTAIFELVITTQTTQQIAALMLLPPGKSLQAMIGPELYTRFIQQVNAHGTALPPESLNRLTPWAAAILLQYPSQQDDGQVLDVRLETMASAKGETLKGLESAAEQIGFFRQLSRKDQIDMLQDTLDHPEREAAELEALTAAYRKKDLNGIEALHQKYLGESEQPDFDRRLDRFLLHDRNARFMARLAPSLHTGNAFIAVGALHLPGDVGLLKGLEKAGYLISQE